MKGTNHCRRQFVSRSSLVYRKAMNLVSNQITHLFWGFTEYPGGRNITQAPNKRGVIYTAYIYLFRGLITIPQSSKRGA